jgi:hypothetical protein
MRTPFVIFLFIALVSIFSCQGQQDDGRTYNKEYVVGSIPLMNDFLTLTKVEKELDSLFNSDFKGISGSQKRRGLSTISFSNNRARIVLYETTNGKQQQKDPSIKKGMPTMCRCALNGDTLEINMAVGFFGGVGLKIKVYGKKFGSWFFQENDNVENLKTTLADTSFSSRVIIENNSQYLIFDRQPNFKPGQQITGYFTFTSEKYFEKKGQNIDTISASGKIHFTCQPIQRIKNQ